MSMRPIKKSSTDQSVVIRIIDSSDGTPETGVDYDTSGIDLWYRREGATKTSITEAALASLDAAHSDGGIEHIGDGYYRLDLPDAAVATGANGVMVGGAVTGMIVIGCYVPLVDYDPYDSVRAGLTALPNAAADAAGGLPISDAGGLDLDTQIGTDIDAILADTNELQTDDVPSLIAALNDLSAAEVNAEVDTALADIHLDHLLATDYDPTSKPGVATALLNELVEDDSGVSRLTANALEQTAGAAMLALETARLTELLYEAKTGGGASSSFLADLTENDGGTYRFTANALEEAPTGGSAPTVEEIRAEMDSNSTQLAAIVADTNELQTDDVPGLIAALNDLSAAEVNAEVDTALADIHLDHLLATDYDPASKPGTATALLNELVENDGGVSRFTENALEQAPSGSGGDATAANQTTIINHLTDVKGTGFVKDTDSLTDLAHTGADSDTLETLSDQLDAIGGGAGAIEWTYTITEDGTPIADVTVWVATDEEGTNIIASGITDQNGEVIFYLDAGTVYLWSHKSGYNFTNPDTEIVAESGSGSTTGTTASGAGAATLATLRDRVEATLQDSSNLTWSTDDIDEAVRQALHRYSKIKPDRTITSIELSEDGREIDISSITDYLTVERVWWDYDDSDPAHPPNWRNFELWPGDIVYINDPAEPVTGDTVRFWYTRLQTLNGLDSASATSLPDDDTTLIVTGAAGLAALARAREISESLAVDGWVHKRLNEWGEKRLEEFEAGLKLVAAQRTAQASGIAPGPVLDRWDDGEWN